MIDIVNNNNEVLKLKLPNLFSVNSQIKIINCPYK